MARTRFLAILATMVAGTTAAVPTTTDHPEWRAPQTPFRIYGNTWYVGTRGLSAILVTSPAGQVLIDGTLPENAAIVEDDIRAAGFELAQVRVILDSHAHPDHAGAIAQLARDTGARVYALPAQASALRQGGRDPEDPQFGESAAFPEIPDVAELADGVEVHVGDLVLTAHATPGHTPGGTSWTWRSCEGMRCLRMAYVDSLTGISRKGFRFTDDAAHPRRVEDFLASFDTVARLPCDVLLTPHPDASDVLARAAAHALGAIPDPLIDAGACKAYAAGARERLQQRLRDEAAGIVTGDARHAGPSINLAAVPVPKS